MPFSRPRRRRSSAVLLAFGLVGAQWLMQGGSSAPGVSPCGAGLCLEMPAR